MLFVDWSIRGAKRLIEPIASPAMVALLVVLLAQLVLQLLLFIWPPAVCPRRLGKTTKRGEQLSENVELLPYCCWILLIGSLVELGPSRLSGSTWVRNG